MGTDLKKVGKGSKIGLGLCGLGVVGGIALAVTGSWIIGGILAVGCVAGGVKFFKDLIKEYASSGKRF